MYITLNMYRLPQTHTLKHYFICSAEDLDSVSECLVIYKASISSLPMSIKEEGNRKNVSAGEGVGRKLTPGTLEHSAAVIIHTNPRKWGLPHHRMEWGSCTLSSVVRYPCSCKELQ